MKKLLLSSAALVAFAGSALAADLPSRKAPVAPPAPVPMWTGFYAGLNAGYNWGTNSNARSTVYAVNAAGQPQVDAGAVMSGYRGVTQSGFIGGAQFGYNYQGFMWQNLVLGLETDISGTGIRGNTYTRGYSTLGSSQSNGATTFNAGLDYLGTVRGRVGYLWTPTLLMYGTAGFAYGGAYANVGQVAYQAVGTGNNTWEGAGRQNQLLTGWTAGGGMEWMFLPNWTLNGAALYWDLGNMNINTVGTGIVGTGGSPGYANGTASVNYQGVKAVAGINYHFTWGAAPIVAKY